MKKLLLILLCLPLMTLAQLPTVTLSGTATICAGDNTPLSFTLGGNPNFTVDYTINGVPASSVFNSTGVNTLNVTPPVGTNTYVLTSITDGNGVVENNVSGSVTITVNPLPTISIGGTTPICAGQSSNLSFTLSGTAPYNVNYLIGSSPANVTLDAAGTVSGTPLSVTPNNTTTYTLVDVTDVNLCSATSNANITIVVNPLPNITINGSSGICLGDSTALAFTILDGTAPFNVTLNDGTADSYWLMDSNGIVNGLPVTISPNNSTTYSLVEATDANGCWNALNGSITIVVYQLPLVTISQNGNVLFVDSISASMPVNYYWNTGSITDTTHINQLGIYTLTVTDMNGCISSTNINVTSLSTDVFDFFQNTNKTLLKITDLLGRETPYKKRTPLFYIYDDGTVEKHIIIE